MIPAYVALRLKLRDRESELGELQRESERLRERLAEAESKLDGCVKSGLELLTQGTVRELEAQRLAAVAMAPEITALESIDPQQED